jgi:GAF domain-containing protein
VESFSALFELATVYYACRDVETLLRTFATRLGADLGARGVLVWLQNEEDDGLRCRGRWSEPGEGIEPVNEMVIEGRLTEVFADGETRRFSAADIDTEGLGHLQESSRERVKTAIYVALPLAHGIVGVVEVLNRRTGNFSATDAAFGEEASRITGLALENLLLAEQERQAQFFTLERLTALYDLSRIFNSTLELDELLPIVTEKIRDIVGAGACNLWLVNTEGTEIQFVQQAGHDPTTQEDGRMPLGEGVLGEVAKQGKGQVVESALEEGRLADRQAKDEGFQIQTMMCAPMMKEAEVLGVVEVVNKLDGTPFDEDDLFFLTSVCEQAAISLHNANLLEAERKVEALDALLRISQEITSTLNLDHVLTTVVNQAGTVVPFDSCAIGYFDRSRFVLGAVSGEPEVPKTREMQGLRDVMEWVSTQTEPVSADEYEGGWKVEPEGADTRLVSYLRERECSGFYALPLRDDQGIVGVLALLSSDAEFLTYQERETVNILANQTCVALRNAELYQHVPLGSWLKPLAERKKKLMTMPSGRWLEIGARIALVAGILTIVPWRMRVGANVTVVPAERRVVSAEVRGVTQHVFVREGSVVTQGDVLAQLDDGDSRVRLAQAQSNLAIARRDLAEAEFRRDLTVSGQARLRAEMYQMEANRDREQVEKARLRAPISGIIITPKVEEKVGKLLTAGEPFCEVVEQNRMAAELNVPESDVALIHPGTEVAVKLNAFPTNTFRGKIDRIGAQTTATEGEQFFVVRAIFDNPRGLARGGMAGRGKITASGGWFHSGWYPVGYVFLRTPFNWAWQKAWTLLP